MICRRMLFGIGCGLWVISAMEISALAATSLDDLAQYSQSNVNPGAINLEQNPTDITKERIPTGNPLWGIPLGSLSITRERPIFTSSRRSAAPPVVAAPRIVAPPPPVVRPAVSEHPNLALIGTVNGEKESIGVFLDQTTQKVVRLRAGEGHLGWILQSVRGREATLEKDHQTETLQLPTSVVGDPRSPVPTK